MTHPIPATVATFRQRREEAGISQRALAELVCTDWSAIRDFERGRCVLSLVKVERRFAALGLQLAVVPVDPIARAREAADWLQAQGWRVEAPPQPEDARAAGGIPGHREKPWQGASTGQETAYGERGGA